MFAKKFRLLGVPLLVVLVLAVMVGTVAAATVIKGTVHPFGEDPRDSGPSGQGTLRVVEDGVHYNIHTMNLDPGAAYTNWAVVFNDPGTCEDDGCGFDDVLAGRGDASAFWAAGEVIPDSSSGAANFAAFIPEGDPRDRGVQVLFGNGLENSETSETHIVIRTHGPALDDPDLLWEQLNTVDGGCGINQCDDQQAVPFFLP
jgi:hypothetical protein